MILQLNPAVRLLPPSEVTGDRWLADDLVKRRRYQLSRRAAAALVAAAQSRDRDGLVEWLAANDPGRRPPADWERVVDGLRSRSLIVDAASAQHDPELAWLIHIRRTWSSFGWDQAADYHLLSFDYPCVDYSEFNIALEADRDRMRRYQATERDTDRFKLEYLDAPEVPLPDPREDL